MASAEGEDEMTTDTMMVVATVFLGTAAMGFLIVAVIRIGLICGSHPRPLRSREHVYVRVGIPGLHGLQLGGGKIHRRLMNATTMIST